MTKEQATQKAKEIAIRFLQYWLKDDKRLANSRFDDWASTPEAQSLISELVEVRKETVRKLLEDCFDIDATQVDRDTYINSRLSESPSDGQDWVSVGNQPEDKWVLLYNGNWIGVGKFNNKEDKERDEPEWQDETSEYISPDPTHWMPLPKPPSQ